MTRRLSRARRITLKLRTRPWRSLLVAVVSAAAVVIVAVGDVEAEGCGELKGDAREAHADEDEADVVRLDEQHVLSTRKANTTGRRTGLIFQDQQGDSNRAWECGCGDSERMGV